MVVVVMMTLAAWVVSATGADDVSPQEEVDSAISQATLNPRPPIGGTREFGASDDEQVPLGALKPSHKMVDVSVEGVGFGGLRLSRNYAGTPDTWMPAKAVKQFGSPYRKFTIRQVPYGEAPYSGAAGQVEANGLNHVIELNMEKLWDSQRLMAGQMSSIPGIMAHELGHQFSRAYEDQSDGVAVEGGVTWRHNMTAIDWENAIQGDPKRPYFGGMHGGADHSRPECPDVPLRCPR